MGTKGNGPAMRRAKAVVEKIRDELTMNERIDRVRAKLDEVEPDSPSGEDTPACPVCSWDCGNHSLGILGSLRWWRCRGCGIDFHDDSHLVREATTLRGIGGGS